MNCGSSGHSHKKRRVWKYRLEMAVLMETSMLCWNLPSGPKHRGSLWKNIVGDFCANLHETNADISWMWFNLQRDGTENGLPNIKDTFAESLKLQMSYLHQSMFICKAGFSRSSSYDGRVKCKKKYLMRQIPIKMLKQHGIPNSSLHNLKIYSSKGCRKAS